LLWWWHAFIARLLRKPIFLAFQGIGPLRTFLAQRLTKWVCVRAAFISVRDQASFERIVGWNVRVPPILSFDPIFEQRTKTFFSSGARRTLGIIPRANSYDEFMVAVSVSLNKPWDFVKIILLQSSADERAVGERIRRLVPGGVPVTIVDVHNFSELITSLSDVTEVVCQRYHGALAAMGLGIPVTIVPQREGDKLQELQVLVSTGRFADLSERVSLGQRALHSALSLAEKRRSC